MIFILQLFPFVCSSSGRTCRVQMNVKNNKEKRVELVVSWDENIFEPVEFLWIHLFNITNKESTHVCVSTFTTFVATGLQLKANGSYDIDILGCHLIDDDSFSYTTYNVVASDQGQLTGKNNDNKYFYYI